MRVWFIHVVPVHTCGPGSHVRSRFTYWAVWVALRNTRTLVEPSSSKHTRASREAGVLPCSGSVVNLTSSSSEFRCWVTSLYCSIANVSSTILSQICCPDSPFFRMLHVQVIHYRRHCSFFCLQDTPSYMEYVVFRQIYDDLYKRENHVVRRI